MSISLIQKFYFQFSLFRILASGFLIFTDLLIRIETFITVLSGDSFNCGRYLFSQMLLKITFEDDKSEKKDLLFKRYQ